MNPAIYSAPINAFPPYVTTCNCGSMPEWMSAILLTLSIGVVVFGFIKLYKIMNIQKGEEI